MASPRFNQNLSDPLQIGQKGDFRQQSRPTANGPETQAITATVSGDHSQTTATGAENHSHAERPTGGPETSDRPDAIDVVFRGAIQQLRMISQSPAASLERHSPSAEKALSLFVDDEAGDLVRRYEGTDRIRNAERCFKIRRELAEAALNLLRQARYSPRGNWIDRQTIEGRYRVAIDPRPASIVAGVYDVPVSTVYRWRAQLPYYREKLRVHRKLHRD